MTVATNRTVAWSSCRSTSTESMRTASALAEGATWLDRQLLSDAPEPLRDSGFGREVGSALAARRQWLLDEQLAHEEGGETRYRRGLLAVLQRRELLAQEFW